MRLPRVLVVDDSALVRTVLARVMRASGLIDVIDTAFDGRDGLERINALDPDVVTLDLTMPGIGGMAILRALRGRSRPRVIVVSASDIDTELGAEALSLGAIELIAKPVSLAADQLDDIGRELVAKVIAAAAGYLALPAGAPVRGVQLARPERATLILIGTSTGGPQALTRLIAALPANLAAPVAVSLHIPKGYTEAIARRLDHSSALDVVEARDGMELRAGLVVLARGGMHLRIERDGEIFRAALSVLPAQPYTPSVNQLLESGAIAAGARALGVVLTGMGDDGLEGAHAIAAAGGSLLTQSAGSCVVYGMPRCVDEAQIGATNVPLDAMAAEIARRV